MTLRNLRIVSSDVKSSSRWLPIWESATQSPTPFAVYLSTKPVQRLSTALQFKHHPHTLQSPSKPGRAKYGSISGTIHRTSTISPIKIKHKGRVVEFEEAPNKDGSRAEREFEGRRPPERSAEEGGSH
nr:hypothetical protein [Tanacetum cinerariifolium]